MPKLIVTIEVEIERNIPDLGDEICRRITMHPYVTDANPICIGNDLTALHAPKPRKSHHE